MISAGIARSRSSIGTGCATPGDFNDRYLHYGPCLSGIHSDIETPPTSNAFVCDPHGGAVEIAHEGDSIRFYAAAQAEIALAMRASSAARGHFGLAALLSSVEL